MTGSGTADGGAPSQTADHHGCGTSSHDAFVSEPKKLIKMWNMAYGFFFALQKVNTKGFTKQVKLSASKRTRCVREVLTLFGSVGSAEQGKGE